MKHWRGNIFIDCQSSRNLKNYTPIMIVQFTFCIILWFVAASTFYKYIWLCLKKKGPTIRNLVSIRIVSGHFLQKRRHIATENIAVQRRVTLDADDVLESVCGPLQRSELQSDTHVKNLPST